MSTPKSDTLNISIENTVNKFEEYTLFVEDTARFTDRRQTANNMYVAVNSLILGAIAFLVQNATFSSIWLVSIASLILLAGISICLQWEQLITRYKRLINFRLTQLKIMEALPEMAGCHQMYLAEDDLYPPPSKKKRGIQGLSFSDRERWLPRVFIIVYVLFLVGFALMLVFAPDQLTAVTKM